MLAGLPVLGDHKTHPKRQVSKGLSCYVRVRLSIMMLSTGQLSPTQIGYPATHATAQPSGGQPLQIRKPEQD